MSIDDVGAEFRRQRQQERDRKDQLRRSRAFGDVTNLYGSADLQYSGPFDLHSLFSPLGGSDLYAVVPLGRDRTYGNRGLLWPLNRLQGHAITFGATRSGKGVQSVIPALLSYSAGSTVIIDPKGENAWVTADARRAMGQRVVILDPWNEINRRYGSKAGVVEETTRFNPLSALDSKSDDFADDVTAIADALIIPGNLGGDSHWTDAARELIAGLVALVVELNPGKASLRDVRKFITGDNKLLVDSIVKCVEAFPDSLATRKLRRFKDASPDNREVAAVRSVAETQTAFLDSERLQEAMATDEPPFNIAELGTSRVSLFLVLPLDRLQTHGRWLRLILTLAIRAIAKQDTPPKSPVLFLLDEFGTIGRLSVVEQAFGLMAGIGIRIWAFLQDLSQLKRDYPNAWETFISNASVIQVLKVSDLTTSKYISELIGNVTQERISAETAKQRAGGIFKSEDPSYSNMADQVFARPLQLPQEIRDIPSSRVLNILPSLGNFYMARMPYYDEDGWLTRFRAMPGFPKKELPPTPTEPPKKKGWFS